MVLVGKLSQLYPEAVTFAGMALYAPGVAPP